MTTGINSIEAGLEADRRDGAPRQGDVSDYVALLKPRVMFLVVFTALVGMVVAHSRRASGGRLRRRSS